MRGTYERIVLGHNNRREDSAGLLKGLATLFDCHNYQVIFSRGSVSCCNARNKETHQMPAVRSLTVCSIRQALI